MRLSEAYRAAVEQLVMEGAKGQTIVRIIRTTEVEPAHVRGLDTHWGPQKRAVVPAEGAGPVPVGQNREPPGRRSTPRHPSFADRDRGRNGQSLGIKSGGRQDLIRQTGWELSINDGARDSAQQFRIP